MKSEEKISGCPGNGEVRHRRFLKGIHAAQDSQSSTDRKERQEMKAGKEGRGEGVCACMSPG